MSGSGGSDRLHGGAFADRLIGGPGKDHLLGGSGSDTISARDRRRDRIDCGGARDKVIADRVDVCQATPSGSAAAECRLPFVRRSGEGD